MSKSEENPLEIQVDLALADYMQRCDSGERLDRESFLAQHPAELREQLSDLLSAADWIEQLAGPTLADLGAVANVPDFQSGDPSEETLPHSPPKVDGVERTLATDVPGRGGTLAFSAGDPLNEGMRELSQPALPCLFGDYVLERVLGRGGMGVVYYGRQIHLDRPVAVKMIRSGALASSEEVARFYAEARSAARLDHPCIVTVYQCGECEGHHYFSMDYVAGTDLARMTRDKPLAGKVAARYVRDVAKAIQFAHDRGILHRDLKPANVLVDENDMVRITDFGLAKSIGTDTGLTATGAALGTPSFMSPEQAAGRVDEHHHATDIYSLGAVLFTIVTGQPPFKASSVLQTLMQVIHRPAPMARSIDKTIDEDLETIIDVCLQKSPDRRYATAQALAADLDRYLVGAPIQARPVSQLRRAWYWLLGVPILGAILDNRVVEPTDAHRWVQRGLISAGVILLCAWALLLIPSSVWYKNRMPRTVRIASGFSQGGYHRVASALSDALQSNAECKTQVLTTEGSSDNLELLINNRVELAMLQADAVGSSMIAVVAPLYYEVVHIVVRADLKLKSINDLRDRLVIVGAEKAGSRNVAELLLQRVGMGLSDLQVIDADWRELSAEPHPADAAVVVSKVGSADLSQLLDNGEFCLLPVPSAWEFALDEPAFHSFIVSPENYPNCDIPEVGITTVATTAYLAATADTPSVLVQQVLKSLYAPEMVAATGILSAERAAHWQGIAWHPAARDFFQPYRGASVNANTVKQPKLN